MAGVVHIFFYTKLC